MKRDRSSTPSSRAFSLQVEEVLRDVAEDDRAGSALECAEADEPFAAPDVEERFAGAQLRVLENAVPPADDSLESALARRHIAARAQAGKPRRPAIRLRHAARMA